MEWKRDRMEQDAKGCMVPFRSQPSSAAAGSLKSSSPTKSGELLAQAVPATPPAGIRAYPTVGCGTVKTPALPDLSGLAVVGVRTSISGIRSARRGDGVQSPELRRIHAPPSISESSRTRA